MNERKLRIGKYVLEEEPMPPIISYLYIKRRFNSKKKKEECRDVEIRIELSVEENIELEKLLDKFYLRALDEIKDKIRDVEK